MWVHHEFCNINRNKLIVVLKVHTSKETEFILDRADHYLNWNVTGLVLEARTNFCFRCLSLDTSACVITYPPKVEKVSSWSCELITRFLVQFLLLSSPSAECTPRFRTEPIYLVWTILIVSRRFEIPGNDQYKYMILYMCTMVSVLIFRLYMNLLLFLRAQLSHMS